MSNIIAQTDYYDKNQETIKIFAQLLHLTYILILKALKSQNEC